MNIVYKPNRHKEISVVACLIFLLCCFCGCKKYLDEKPLRTQVVPTNLTDLQALLDNQNANNNTAGTLLEMVADNYYISDADWQTNISGSATRQTEAQHYIWLGEATPYDRSWVDPYQSPVYISNIVLDHLSIVKVEEGEEQRFNQVKGAALFYRAFAFHQLAQLYCKPYSPSAGSDPGIVLRMTSNINEVSTRATVQQTYDRIITDLKEAFELLPATTLYATQPNKTAAAAALARTYLTMRDYDNAKIYANQALQFYSVLKDYNELVPVAAIPIQSFNPEVIFHSSPTSGFILANSIAKIDSLLYQSYAVNDLRKSVFFRANTGANAGTYAFQGSYHGTQSAGRIFDGLTTGELFLIRAECHARAGDKEAALTDLNTLMSKRWKNDGSWQPFDAATAEDAKNMILAERRKELVFRGQRWSDLRRLNMEGANITLTRSIAGTQYSLPPNDLRSVMLIPWDVVNRSGIAQNPR